MNFRDKMIAFGASGALALSVSTVIVESEGYQPKPYLDPKNILTVCYGHTGGINKNKTYSQDECLLLLKDDAEKAEDVLKNSVKPEIYAKLKDYEKAAFISFIYNVGAGKKGVKDGFVALKKTGQPSTMLRKINQGDIKGACQQFMSWTQEGQGLAGIKIRRIKERNLCLGTFR